MPRRRAHLSTPRTRWHAGLQWIRNADGVWGTLEWHLVGRREWYYGWPNPYLWPRDEDGQFRLMTIPMVMPSCGSPCTNTIGKGRDGLPGASGKMLRTTSPVRGLGSVRSRRPHRVTVSVRRYIDMNKVERHKSAYLWRSRPSRVSAPPPRGHMASAPS